MPLQPGARLGPYHIVESIGEGGMGLDHLLARRTSSADFAVDVTSGAERVVTTVDFRRTADGVSGLSISRDGTRLYPSFADWPYDIWMLEGFR
jgi:hypothetical protein